MTDPYSSKEQPVPRRHQAIGRVLRTQGRPLTSGGGQRLPVVVDFSLLEADAHTKTLRLVGAHERETRDIYGQAISSRFCIIRYKGALPRITDVVAGNTGWIIARVPCGPHIYPGRVIGVDCPGAIGMHQFVRWVSSDRVVEIGSFAFFVPARVPHPPGRGVAPSIAADINDLPYQGIDRPRFSGVIQLPVCHRTRCLGVGRWIAHDGSPAGGGVV